MKVRIYTYSTIKSIRPAEGIGLYVLATEIGGQEATLSGQVIFRNNPQKGEIKSASAKVSDLIVNLKAIERLTIKCDALEIYTDSSFFVAGWEAGWIDKWKSNDWKNAKGEEVSHADLWKEIDSRLTELKLTPVFHLMEQHPFKNWLEREAEKLKEQLNG